MSQFDSVQDSSTGMHHGLAGDNGHHKGGDLDRAAVSLAYEFWAPVYDAICGPILESGRKAAARAAVRAGRRILEVGVGTGLSLRHYSADTDFTGIDVCEHMVAKARSRALRLSHAAQARLLIMDAHDLAFADATFDCAVLPFVLTLVEYPERVLSECFRVVRPGGDIVVVSHLYSEQGVAASLESWFAKRLRRVGLRPDFPFRRIADWAAQEPDAVIAERAAVAPAGIYTLVRVRRGTPGNLG